MEPKDKAKSSTNQGEATSVETSNAKVVSYERSTPTSNDYRQRQEKRFPRKERDQRKKNDNELSKKILSIRRVTRVYEGGKRMRLSVCVAVGNKKGKIGIGTGKGADVRTAEEKASIFATKRMISVPLSGRTIPHEASNKYGACKLFMKPASPGTGIVAGTSVRDVLELAGVKDILTKVLGSSNPIGNAYLTVQMLSEMKTRKAQSEKKEVKDLPTPTVSKA